MCDCERPAGAGPAADALPDDRRRPAGEAGRRPAGEAAWPRRWPTREIVDELFLATLSRPPDAGEKAAALDHVSGAADREAGLRRRAVGADQHPRIHPEPLTCTFGSGAASARRLKGEHRGLTPRRSANMHDRRARRRPARPRTPNNPRADAAPDMREQGHPTANASTAATSCPSARPGCSAWAWPTCCGPRPGQARAAGQGPTASSWSGSAGGPATIDMWDLKPDAAEEIRGEFRPIATTAAGVRVCEHLPRTAKVMDHCAAGPLAPPHHPRPRRRAPPTWRPGNPPTAALDYPSLGSAAAKLLPAADGRAAVRRPGRARPASPAAPATSARPTTRSTAGDDRRRPAASRAWRCRRLPAAPSWRTASGCAAASTAASGPSTRRTCRPASTSSAGRRADILRSDRVRQGVRPVGASRRRSATSYGRDAARPGGADGPPADRGGGAVRDGRVAAAGTRTPTTSAPCGGAAAAAGPRRWRPWSATWRTAGCSTGRWSSAPASSAGRRGSTARPAGTTGRGRWPRSRPAAGSRGARPTAAPTPTGRPRTPTPVRRPTWRRPC